MRFDRYWIRRDLAFGTDWTVAPLNRYDDLRRRRGGRLMANILRMGSGAEDFS